MLNRYTISKIFAFLATATVLYHYYSNLETQTFEKLSDNRIRNNLFPILVLPFALALFMFNKRHLDSLIQELSNRVNDWNGQPRMGYQNDIFDNLWTKFSENMITFMQNRQRNFLMRRYLDRHRDTVIDEISWQFISDHLTLYSSSSMRRYLEKFERNDVIFNSNYVKQFCFTDKVLKPFLCHITHDVADYPVLLDGRLYDLISLLKLPANAGVFDRNRKDPFTNEPFSLLDIQPARDIQSAFEEMIEKCKKEIPIADGKAMQALNAFKLEDYNKAKKLFKEAIRIYHELGVKHPLLSLYYYNLSSTYDHLAARKQNLRLTLNKAILFCQKSIKLKNNFGIQVPNNSKKLAVLQAKLNDAMKKPPTDQISDNEVISEQKTLGR